MEDEMKANVTDEDAFIRRFTEVVNDVVVNNKGMIDAKTSIVRLWNTIPEDRQKEIANKLFTRLSRMETVVQSLVGEFGIMSINTRT